jgi:hypothetical protein
MGLQIAKRAICIATGLALAALPATLLAQRQYAYVGTSLFGTNEPNGGAGDEASGDFSAEFDFVNGRMCYMLEIYGIDDFTAAHLHEGGKGSDGPPIITLELIGDDGDDVCIDVDKELMEKIVRNRGRYYVNVHSTAFPMGAVRGQLSDS